MCYSYSQIATGANGHRVDRGVTAVMTFAIKMGKLLSNEIKNHDKQNDVLWLPSSL